MKRKTWLYGAAVLVVAATLLAWAFAPRPLPVELATVTQGRFETWVEEDAKTRLADRYVVSAPLAGRLERITLREGDAVTAGMAVAQLTPVLPALIDERTLRELRARLEGANANLARAGTRIERSRVALEQARNDLRRAEQLASEGFVSPTKLETDRLTALAAQKEVDAARAERDVALHDAEQARAALGAAQPPAAGAPRGGFAVRSPVAGQVLRVLQPSEGTVALGTALVELGNTAQLEVMAELLTTDALAAVPGSPVRIERWGGPLTLEGRVRRVEPGAFTKISALGVEEQRVRVLIDITSPREQWQALGDGYRVSVRIVTLARDDAVLVPVSAVFPLPGAGPADAAPAAASNGASGEASAAHAVFVAEGGRARQVPVLLAGRNPSHAWVRSGVAPGQRVIVYPPSGVKDGVRVVERKV